MIHSRRELIDDHLRRLYACRDCPTVAGLPVTGAAPRSRILLVGQAPGPHEQAQDRPFAWSAGKRLFEWFATIGMDEEEVRRSIWISATIRCFPGRDARGKADRVPLPDEVRRCSKWMDAELAFLAPELVIAVGLLAARQFLTTAGSLTDLVGSVHRSERSRSDVVVLPHPSGRSTWLNSPLNRVRLEAALDVIGRHHAMTRNGRPASRRSPRDD